MFMTTLMLVMAFSTVHADEASELTVLKVKQTAIKMIKDKTEEMDQTIADYKSSGKNLPLKSKCLFRGSIVGAIEFYISVADELAKSNQQSEALKKELIENSIGEDKYAELNKAADKCLPKVGEE